MGKVLAVLVDGDNVSAAHAMRILAIPAPHGPPAIVRVYADARCASGWHDAIGYSLIHAGTGKNAADLLLAIDAVEVALSGRAEAFVIASSDGDFSHLAHRLRAFGAEVTGVGEAKAPRGFRAACTEFVELGAGAAIQLVPKSDGCPTDLDQKIRAMIATHSKNGAGIKIADLSPKMHAMHGTRISTFPEKSWRAYLSARPLLYELDPRGPEAKVRFRSQGFVRVA